jgi:hypothetical protein
MSSKNPKKVPIVPIQRDTSFHEVNFSIIPTALYLQQVMIDTTF